LLEEAPAADPAESHLLLKSCLLITASVQWINRKHDKEPAPTLSVNAVMCRKTLPSIHANWA